MTNRAWVTLATNDSYGLGALVLAHSLRRVGSGYPAVVLITPSVTDAMRDRLRAVFAEVITVDVLDSQDAAHLALLQRPELGITFTKIHCWNLTQYEKCVFLDADALVVQNCDELFEREELSAAPDVGWPDCFNSGVFVFKPSADTFSRLITFARERGSFDGGDQGLLNSFFPDWSTDSNKRLPFLYNVTSAAFYSYLPALKHYGQDLKIIHFIGPAKPWLQHFDFESQSVDAPVHLKAFLQLWWDLFTSQVHSQLNESMTGVAGNLARVQPGVPLQREVLDELSRRQGWESGNIDYMGADSFANIWAKISQTLSQEVTKQPSPPKEYSPKEKAKDEMHELVEKVTAASLNETNDIPVPAREAANAAGKSDDSVSELKQNTQGKVPESSPESVPILETKPNVETDVKTDILAPEKTVVAVEPTLVTNPTELSIDDVPTSTPSAISKEAPIKPNISSDLHENKNLEPISTSEVHGVKSKNENDVPKTDVVSEQPTEMHVSDTFAVSPQSSPSELIATSAVVETSQAHESIEVPAGETDTKPLPETTSVVPTVDNEKLQSHESKLEPAVCVLPAGEIDTKLLPETTLVVPTVDNEKVQSHESKLEPAVCVLPAGETDTKPLPETTSVVAAVDSEKLQSHESKLEPAVCVLPPSDSATETFSLNTETEQKKTEPVISELRVEEGESAPKADEPKIDTSTEAPFDVPTLDPKPATPVQIKQDCKSVPEVPKQEKSPENAKQPVSDSPPLANTPSTEEVPSVPAAKLEERRRLAAKLQLKPPSAADPLPTPDSEFEDAASIAQSIIASELRTPTVTSATPPADSISPQPQTQQEKLEVKKPDVPTPPVGAVSLSQIGVKPKTKPTTASQIESSINQSEKAEAEPPKKKLVKKAVKKDGASSGEAPVPPPRKKEKKPKEK